MNNQHLNPQELAIHNMLAFNLLRHGSSVVYDMYSAGALSGLTARSYLAALGTMATRGADKVDDGVGPHHIYQDEQNYRYQINTYSPEKGLSCGTSGAFHEKVISDFGITVEDLAQVHPTTIGYLLRSAGQRTISLAVQNSTPKQVQKFLAQIIPGTTSDQRGDNKCSVAGALTFCRCDDIIKHVQDKVPNWGQTLDHRQRNTLFYCWSKQDFDTAISSGAAPTQKDKNGRDVATWWNLSRSPQVSAELCHAMSELGQAGSPTPTDLMVNKFMRLGFSQFDEQDKEEFQKALAEKDWKWKGTLEGVDHEWSLSEIWKFGELVVIQGRGNPLDEKLPDGLMYSKSRRSSKADLHEFIQSVRSKLPKQFLSQLQQPQTCFDYALDFLGMVPPMLTNKAISSSNSYRARHYTESEQMESYMDHSLTYLGKLDRAGQEKLIEGLEVLRDAKWAWDPYVVKPLLAEIAGSLKDFNLLDRPLWVKHYLSVPLKHAFHATPLQKIMDRYCRGEPIVRSAWDDPLTAQVRIKTLGGIALADSYPEKSWSYLNQLVEDGALKGVEIPTRWLKNLASDTRVCVAKALLENKAAKQRQNIVEPSTGSTPAKPKM